MDGAPVTKILCIQVYYKKWRSVKLNAIFYFNYDLGIL